MIHYSHQCLYLHIICAQVERECNVARTKAALEYCKENNIKVGRPKDCLKLKLDDNIIEIKKMIDEGIKLRPT